MRIYSSGSNLDYDFFNASASLWHCGYCGSANSGSMLQCNKCGGTMKIERRVSGVSPIISYVDDSPAEEPVKKKGLFGKLFGG